LIAFSLTPGADMSRKVLIPFTRRGNVYRAATLNSTGVKWIENHTFDASLTFASFVTPRRRNATYVELKDTTTNKYYPMFLSDFERLLQSKTRKTWKGTWTFVKHGSFCGVRLLDN